MKHSNIFAALSFLLIVCNSAAWSLSAEEPALQAGAAAVDISPETLPALMNGGFLQRSADVVFDRLHARSLVISDGNETIAIVIVDSCMFPTTLCDEIKRLASQQTKIPQDRILISATHTHSAPAAMMALGCPADDPYVKFVPARVAQSIADAYENLQPAKLGWKIVDAADLTNCRRWITRSDRMGTDPFGEPTVRAMMNPGFQNPKYTRSAGPIDPWLSILSVVSTKDESPICVMANLSMHYFGGEGGFSADYFGETARLLEARIGQLAGKASPGFVGIMSQGTSGDLHWRDFTQPHRGINRQQYAESVADRVLQAWNSIEHRSNHSIAMTEQRLTIDRRTPSQGRREWARPIIAAMLEGPARDRVEVYAQQAEWLHENPKAEVVLQAVRIGELGITAIPNEVYAITGLKLRRQSPLAATFNLELANGATGYIPPPEQYALGGYTTWPARTAGLDEQAEPLIVETLLSLLETVSQKERRTIDMPHSPYSAAVAKRAPVAYWRLEDIDSTQVTDSVGANHARYRAGVALFLPGADGFGCAAGDYGNRSVYLAGGHIEAELPQSHDDYSVSLWFWNALPPDARGATGIVLSTGAETLLIAGNANGDQAGRLVLKVGEESFIGKTTVTTKHWHQVTVTRDADHLRVYLDGRTEPEIDASVSSRQPVTRLLVGADGISAATFDGQVDEVALFDRALTPQDVASDYETATAKKVKHTSVREDNPAEKLGTNDGPTEQPTPTKASQALETIHVREGYEVQLVAAEPLVMDPVAIDWGPDGKLWVVEMADYPLGVDGQGQPGGRVRFLEDTDDDGKYDTSTLFAEGLTFPNGVLVWGRGILITAAPEIMYLEDSSGDGKADVRRVLYSGFLEGNQQLRVNGLRAGLDNWVYCASGSHHGGYGKDSQITSHLTGERYQVGSRDFRIQPDTGGFDPQSGPSQYGRNRDDWGSWFGVQNSRPLWHYVLADNHIRRNPHFAPPNPKFHVVTPANPRVYPASQPQKRYHSFTQSGRFTSACSAMIYRDDLLFDRGVEQHAFTCEPFHNLVQHNLIKDQGVSFQFRRDPAEQETDFFASEDRWCRPVMARTGPDGALWVVDMYRYMIEHPEWLPELGQNELRPWYRSGENHGRIYRIVRSDRPLRQTPKLAERSTVELVAALESPNGWQRDAAQRLLVRGKQLGAVEPLSELATSSPQPLARLHALWTLDGLDALSTDTLQAALADRHPGVRRNAVRIAGWRKVDVGRLASLVDDPDAKIRLELATTLGTYDSAAASEALAELAVGSSHDPYTTAAVMSSLNPHNVFAVLTSVHQLAKSDAHNDAPSVFRLIEELTGQVAAMCEHETIGQVVELVIGGERDAARKFRVMARVLDGLQSRGFAANQFHDIMADRIKTTIQEARIAAVDDQSSDAVRRASVQLLGREREHSEEDLSLMAGLLVPQSSTALQRAVVDRLAGQSEPSVAEALLAGWQAHSPELRSRILELLASRRSWAEFLREHVQAGTIRPSELSAPVRQSLLERSENSSQWQTLLSTKAETDRADVLRTFQPALQLDGNADRGALVFRKQCINCHKVKDEGYEVGPELASITNKTKDALLSSILDPSDAVDAKYFNYSIMTLDGQVFSGRMETETASSITLLAAEGKRHTVLRRDIDVLRASTKSLMPDGLEQGLTPQDLADCIQFIRETYR